jgi:D-aminopeptidase
MSHDSFPSGACTFGFQVGDLPPGSRNALSDVPGVRVGHRTVATGDLRTGVTAILPHGGNLYRDKVPAACHVINGFGKSVGLMQIEELGTLETPILLTNTFGVGTCANALIRRAIRENPDIGRQTATVNPVVAECNDGYLSDIQALAITEADAEAAIAAADIDFERGSVGAGTGMSCFGFKGGIGTASRRIALDGGPYHVGCLVLANFGRAGDLVLPGGQPAPPPAAAQIAERGSIIIVIGTDLPVDHRQLARIIRRTGVGLARLGSFWGHGSGDLALGFSTASRIAHDETSDFIETRMLNERRIDLLFRAVADVTEESALDAMLSSPTTEGRAGHSRTSLGEALHALRSGGLQ